MSGIKYITITQLFWDTLEAHRGHPRYPDFRNKIARTVARKVEDRNFNNSNDTMFLASANRWLAGIWHAKLSVNPDIVMFYTVDSDTINLAMIGSHHDYPHQAGKHKSKAEALGGRIRNSIEKGHVVTPSWSRLKWSTPADLMQNPELEELSLDHLVEIEEVLKLELEHAPLFEKLHGHRLDDADVGTFTRWLEETDRALEAVDQAQTAVRSLRREKDRPNTEVVPFLRRQGL